MALLGGATQQINIPSVREKIVKIQVGETEREFLINTFDLVTFNRTLPIVGRFIVLPMATMYGGVINNAVNEGQSVDFSETLPIALMQVIGELDGDGLTKLYQTMFAQVYCEGRIVSQVMDDIFMEDPFAALELLTCVIEANYLPFFKKGGFQRILSRLVPMASLKSLFQEK